MGDNSRISWTDATWNPVTGCSKVSEGCRHCYAEDVSHRYKWTRLPWTANNAPLNVVCHEDRLEIPLRWKRPRRVFVNSMSDLFHEAIPQDFIDRVFAVMALAYRHTFQVLTKRPERMAAYLNDPETYRRVLWKVDQEFRRARPDLGLVGVSRPPADNVWLGVSCERQREADERIPWLLKTPAKVCFLSCEPLLGPLDLTGWLLPSCGRGPDSVLGDHLCGACNSFSSPIHWVIVGGESGRYFRPMQAAWARDIADQCMRAGVAFFFKQDASRLPGASPYIIQENGTCVAYQQFPGNSYPGINVQPDPSDPRPREMAKAYAARHQTSFEA